MHERAERQVKDLLEAYYDALPEISTQLAWHWTAGRRHLAQASTRELASVASSVLFEVPRAIALRWCQPSLEMRHGVDRADQFAG